MPRKPTAQSPIQTIQLDAEMKAVVQASTDAHGIPGRDVVRRLLRWFDDLDDVSQQAVLGVLPDSLAQPDTFKLIMDTLSRKQAPRLAAKPDAKQPRPAKK